MPKTSKNTDTIAVIGLGYVGLPLAVALAKHFPVVGFDVNADRIKEIKQGHDRTNEITPEVLRTSSLHVTTDLEEIRQKNVYIVTVPTPVTSNHKPDLEPLNAASQTVGKIIGKGAIVVFESTVYPGVTEEYCGPIIEKHSGLVSGKDFFLGYSPERINPGDKVHTVEKIQKVISGQTPAVVTKLAHIYGSINHDNLFIAKNIKVAEAAKVIENTQRDINIAFINEVAVIANKLNISVYDILDAANSKWNFLPFQPGLVGGHCIGVDPYYLAECAQKLHHMPEIILAGRHTNERMAKFIAEAIDAEIKRVCEPKKTGSQKSASQKPTILVLGLTFKENVPDCRNTKVLDLINALKEHGYAVDVHDPCADPKEVKQRKDIDLVPHLDLELDKQYDAIIGAVPHDGYRKFTTTTLEKLVKPGGLVADIKRIWHDVPLPEGRHYWCL